MRAKIFSTAFFVLVFCATAVILPLRAGAQARGALIFEDTFNQPALDSTYWNPFITDNTSGGWPWSYQAGQPVESSAVDLPNGFALDYDLPSLAATGSGLNLQAQAGSTATGYTWSGATICSYPNTHYTDTIGVTFQDAYVEVSAKMPYAGNGSWPAIWFMPGPGGNGGEIDLHEGGFILGSSDPDHVLASHLHTGDTSAIVVDTGVSLSGDYHTYGMEYRQGQSIKIYFDGALAGTFTADVPTGPYFIILTNAVASSGTTGWHSQVTASTASPNVMRVAYVRVYNVLSPPAAPTGLTATPGNALD